MQPRVLIGSVVQQKPDIVEEFFKSLSKLDTTDLIVDYVFVDNTSNGLSQKLLQDSLIKTVGKKFFYKYKKDSKKMIIESADIVDAKNINDRLIAYKNKIIKHSGKNMYDYLFLIDADIILQPQTLKYLIADQKDIVSNMTVTRWGADDVRPPWVCLYDQDIWAQNKMKNIMQEQIHSKKNEYMERLTTKKGTYEVGSISGCMLVSKRVLQKGVSFKKIPNIQFWGEDYSFVIRARVHGFHLYMATTCPAYRISDEEGRCGAEIYDKDWYQSKGIFAGLPVMSEIKADIDRIVRAFICSYLSYDYRITTGFEGVQHMTTNFRNKFTQVQDTMMNDLYERRVKCRVLPAMIHANTKKMKKGVIGAEAGFILKKICDGEEQEQKFRCHVVLNNVEQGKWYVDSVSFENQFGKSLLGISVIDLLEEKERMNKMKNNQLTLAILVRNESERTLYETLSHAAAYINNAVIFNAENKAGVADICEKTLCDIPYHLISNRYPSLKDEILLRKQLWNLTVGTHPDWILCLDADEMFEDRIIGSMEQLINQPEFDYYMFPVNYENGSAGTMNGPLQTIQQWEIRLTRYQPHYCYVWDSMKGQCNRLPENVNILNGCDCNIGIRHFDVKNAKLK